MNVERRLDREVLSRFTLGKFTTIASFFIINFHFSLALEFILEKNRTAVASAGKPSLMEEHYENTREFTPVRQGLKSLLQ